MPIDLRSDTVTRPTDEMRRAMASAEVGDDVYAEDPTVNRLQELSAAMLGKQAALFVASGTMGNLISLLCHAPRGAEVILGDESHIFHYEQGGASAVGSLVYHTVPTQPNGQLALDDLRGAIRNKDNVHFAAPGVICLENTHNRCGGAVLPVEYCREVRALADSVGVPLHLDGARLANAAVASGVSMKDLAAPFDSVQFDLSKGLGAPVGGVVAGSAEFISKARRARKMLGGGMRQAGIIAAGGIIALEKRVDRLAEDHAKARQLAEGLADHPKIRIDVAGVVTNIVLVHLRPPLTPKVLIDALRERGVLAGSPAPTRVRFVTHYDVSGEEIKTVIKTVREVLDRLA